MNLEAACTSIVLLTAAVGKARGTAGFVAYLRWPYPRVATGLAAAVITAEVATGTLLWFPAARQIALWSAIGLYSLFSLYLAVRFAAGEHRRCACFGASGEDRPGRLAARLPAIVGDRVLQPVAMAIRNGALIGVAFAGTHGLADLSSMPLLGMLTFPAAALIVACCFSLWRESRLLRLGEHPRYWELAPSLRMVNFVGWYEGSRTHPLLTTRVASFRPSR